SGNMVTYRILSHYLHGNDAVKFEERRALASDIRNNNDHDDDAFQDACWKLEQEMSDELHNLRKSGNIYVPPAAPLRAPKKVLYFLRWGLFILFYPLFQLSSLVYFPIIIAGIFLPKLPKDPIFRPAILLITLMFLIPIYAILLTFLSWLIWKKWIVTALVIPGMIFTAFICYFGYHQLVALHFDRTFFEYFGKHLDAYHRILHIQQKLLKMYRK
ncbi:MAG: hypothetical protein AAF570_20475, partial [Bacteroidota bacterium]